MIKIVKNVQLSDLTFMRKPFSAEREETVKSIIADVRARGDAALIEYGKKFDNAPGDSLLFSKEEIDAAFDRVDKRFIAILEEAKRNIEEFHRKQLKDGFEIKRGDGCILGQRYTAIEKAGVYVPGGTAAYPSTVLMNVIPAVVAGVGDITMCTPSRGGIVKDELLAAAKLCGVTRIIKCGGAQAIAAMAYGSESVPKCDVITGPGNAFVALAKKLVSGDVGIDMIAGPSEILIIADGGANVGFVARDMLSQAEHDALATSVLLTDSEAVATAVQAEIEKLLRGAGREEIARASIDNNGLIVIVNNVDEAVRLSDEIAPEHLELCVREPFALLQKVKNAGSIFLGDYTPEPLGDYFAGPNHTLPTGGSARFSSPLSVDAFMKKSSYIYYTKEATIAAADKVAEFAEREGLYAHGDSILARKEEI